MEQKCCISVMSALVVLVVGCKKLYHPVVISSSSGGYLVVEGLINTGTDTTHITLSRTIPLNSVDAVKPETHAQVNVETDQGGVYPLTETDTGTYTLAPLNLGNSPKYRLRIQTADGRSYLSDFTQAVSSPAIDTFTYTASNSGVSFFVSTHDAANKAQFYRWDYTETYIYQSAIDSPYEFINNPKLTTSLQFRPRPLQDQVHICYVTQNSSSTIINSTAALKQDVIVNNPIAQIPATSEKFYYRYSILVRQYALTEDAYNFWTALKRNTEQIGTIFDAQPSEVPGNIHCLSNQGEPVIGYVSAGTTAEKRIFIDNSQLPFANITIPECASILTFNWYEGATPSDITSGTYIPISHLTATYDPPHQDTIYAVEAAEYDCVDCRFHLHGTNIKPSFWK